VSPARFPRLLGDVGGTNARWAWQAAPGEALAHVRSLPTADHASIADCIAAYLAANDLPAPREVAFGIATAVTGDRVQMTNHAWVFSIEDLKRTLGTERVRVLNDFEALAYAVPGLRAGELRADGGAKAQPDAATGA
jgi:glucokinase